MLKNVTNIREIGTLEKTDIVNGANLENKNELEIDDTLDDPEYKETNETLDSEDGLDKNAAEEGRKRRKNRRRPNGIEKKQD